MNYRRSALPFTVGLLLIGPPAQGAVIPGLFPSGVDPNGTILPSGSIDPHWRLVQSADLAFPGRIHWS